MQTFIWSVVPTHPLPFGDNSMLHCSCDDFVNTSEPLGSSPTYPNWRVVPGPSPPLVLYSGSLGSTAYRVALRVNTIPQVTDVLSFISLFCCSGRTLCDPTHFEKSSDATYSLGSCKQLKRHVRCVPQLNYHCRKYIGYGGREAGTNKT